MRLKDRLFILMQHVLPQHTLSRLMGKCAASEQVWLKNLLIRAALKRFAIQMETAQNKQALSYPSFNAFFTRALEAQAALLFPPAPQLGSPAEGTVSQLGRISAGALIQAKGKTYEAKALLARHAWSEAFISGSFATIYLAPHNYHRVHCPVAGLLTEITYVPGKLFSVNLVTADHINDLFARNERMIFYIETTQGKVAVVMVGAMLVAGMQNPFVNWTRTEMKSLQSQRFKQPLPLKTGDELGYFNFGSTVVLCFENQNLTWEVATHTDVRLGQVIASQQLR